MTRITVTVAVCMTILAIKVDAQCRERNGRFEVSDQCDAYINCVDGVPEQKLCPDGLLFNEANSSPDNPCQFPSVHLKCGNRLKLQPAQPTSMCPHQYGMFRIGDSSHCGQYMNCAKGESIVYNCTEGLAFNKETYRCDWPEEVADCDPESYLNYRCPDAPRSKNLRDDQDDLKYYASPHDCYHYYICVNGRPRLYKCPQHLSFNEETHMCTHNGSRPECVRRRVSL